MDPAVLGGILGLLGGIVSGVITAKVAINIENGREKNLEKEEIRRRRVEVIYRLLGSRYILIDGYPSSSNETMIFNTSTALLSVYYADDSEIVQQFDAFATHGGTDKLVLLLRTAARRAGFELNDSDITRVTTTQARIAIAEMQHMSNP